MPKLEYSIIPCYFTLEELIYMQDACNHLWCYEGDDADTYKRVIDNLEGKIAHEKGED